MCVFFFSKNGLLSRQPHFALFLTQDEASTKSRIFGTNNSCLQGCLSLSQISMIRIILLFIFFWILLDCFAMRSMR